MALTATATREVRKNVMKVLGMSAPSCRVINISPEKANIFLAVREKVCVKEYVQRVASVLMQKQIHSEKMLIFCRRYEDCYEFYRTFKTILGKQFTFPEGAPNLPQFRVVDMFTRCTQTAVKDHKITEFAKCDGTLRIVIATIAFGMGVDCPNISCVLHWGPSEIVLDYVQEIGRAGRDGESACALLYFSPWDKAHVKSSMVDYSINHTECKRKQLFKEFDSFYADQSLVKGCQCCFVCAHKCQCGSCSSVLSRFVYNY